MLLERLRASLAGRYALERPLGSGGMAHVFLAREPGGRAVALKVLRPELAAVTGVQRFLREIAIAARLDHPHIMPLLDAGEAAGLPFYAMPLAEGASLRHRLQREPQLPIVEAVRIACEVASALARAHADGIVHRDIKPDNILFDGERALVADFGIARAVLVSAPGDSLATTGITIGTPAYMAPEQAAGAQPVDGRADVYALACVLYEMLVGAPPFTGPTPQAVLARHQFDPVPPPRTVRPAISEALEQVILQGLAKVPADRYAGAAAFAGALQAVISGAHRRPAPRRRALVAAAAVVGAVALALAVGNRWMTAGAETTAAAPPDTSHYVILAGAGDPGTDPALVTQLLRDALRRWDGIAVSEPFQVRDALDRLGLADTGLALRDARRVAATVGAGRYVRLTVTRMGAARWVRAVAFDREGSGGPLVEARIALPAEWTGADTLFAALADSLLLREATGVGGALPGTRSMPARQAFARGMSAISAWDLAAAESSFAAAEAFDQQYAEALLWLALTRWWADQPVPRWRPPAERAGAALGRLPGRDSALAAALVVLGAGLTERACGLFDGLARRERFDVAAWYSTATCLRRDSAVVRDLRSPSGWRFRSGRHGALAAYQRAFALHPAIQRSLRRDAFQPLLALFMTRSGQLLRGRAVAPDTGVFRAYPALDGDSVVFVPWPAQDFDAARPWTLPPSSGEAVRRQRAQFRDVALSWTAAYPDASDAQEALALAADLLGDPEAAAQMRRAASLASAPEERLRLLGAAAWMQLKVGVPQHRDTVRAARALADSVIRAARHQPTDPRLIASLLALTGRAHEAASLYRQAAAGGFGAAVQLAHLAPTLLLYAAFGGPLDTLLTLAPQVRRAIDGLRPEERPRMRAEWLIRAATLGFPGLREPLQPAGGGNYLAVAQAAFASGDRAAARAAMTRVQSLRGAVHPAELSFDALVAEATLLVALGDSAAAITRLDPTLEALAAVPVGSLTDPVRAASLLRAMVLRSDLARARGDVATARRWSTVVLALWQDADATFRPVLERLAADTILP